MQTLFSSLKDKGHPAMFEGTPQTWVEQNFTFGNAITLIVALVTFVAGYTRLGERNNTNMAEISKLNLWVKEVEDDVETHCSDKAIHRDPERDERRLQAIEAGIKEILAELRKPVTGRHGRG